jgi:hypothetical protein
MMSFNFNSGLHIFTVIPASPFGDLHRQAGTQSAVWLRYEGLGPGLRRDDEDLQVTSFGLTNASIHLPSQAKMPQTAIQMRGFNL